MQSATNPRVRTHLRWAIWVYFFLLIFEGVFRKWILPQFSDVLLVVRDPVVLVIYMLAIKARLFPRNMCVLLAVQFNSAPDAFINRTAGLGDTQQITAGGGKIRPPGTFSFVSGVIFYAAMAAAYLLYGALTRGIYKNWLLFGAGLALVLAIGVS